MIYHHLTAPIRYHTSIVTSQNFTMLVHKESMHATVNCKLVLYVWENKWITAVESPEREAQYTTLKVLVKMGSQYTTLKVLVPPGDVWIILMATPLPSFSPAADFDVSLLRVGVPNRGSDQRALIEPLHACSN